MGPATFAPLEHPHSNIGLSLDKQHKDQEKVSPLPPPGQLASPEDIRSKSQHDRGRFMLRLKTEAELSKTFLSKEQVAALEHDDPDTLEEANDAALQQALKASQESAGTVGAEDTHHKPSVFDTDGNREILSACKKETAAYFDMPPLEEDKDDQGSVSSDRTSTTFSSAQSDITAPTLFTASSAEMSPERRDKEMLSMAAGNEKFLQSIDSKGFTAIPNSGVNHNCATISALILASGNPDEAAHTKTAERIKAELVERFPEEVPDLKAMIHADTRSPAFRYMVAAVNQHCGTDMDLHVVTASSAGEAVLDELDSLRQPTGKNPAVMWNQGAHFLPIVKKPVAQDEVVA
jgi:hypothetical protein